MTIDAKTRVARISLLTVALAAGSAVSGAYAESNPDAAAAITALEQRAVEADLAGDSAFYSTLLANGWTRGDSDGTFYTKAQLVAILAGRKITTRSEKLSGLKVRVYGDTAVATYKDSYDIVIMGQHRAHTIIATDSFAKIGGEWKQVASHGSVAK